MQLTSLEIEGFRSFREPERVDLSGLVLAAVTGPNHAGKTSVLRAIEYALYGPRHGEAAGLVSHGARLMRVRLVLRSGPDEWAIERSHRAGGTGQKLLVTRNGTPEGARDLATTQSVIDDVVGMPREVSRATWMAMQGEVDALCLMDGPTRRQVLIQALGLDAYEAQARVARERRKAIATRIATIEGERSGLAGSIELDPGLAHLSDDELAAEARAVEQRSAREGLAAHVEDLRGIVAQEDEQLAIDEQSAAGVAGLAEQANRATAELDRAQHQDGLARDESAAARHHLADLERRLGSAREALAAMHDGPCPTCHQEMPVEVRETLRATMSAEAHRLSSEADVARVREDECREVAERAREELDLAAGKSRRAIAELDQATRAERDRDARSTRLVRLRDELTTKESELAAMPIARATTEPGRASREQALRAQLAANTARAEDLAARADELSREQQQLDLLVQAFSPSGIPMAVLRGVADEVSRDATETLAAMASDLEVVLDADGSGVDVTVALPGREPGPWASLSGQERFYTSLALRMSLGRAVARRTGRSIGTMLLDEGWGALDESHAQKAVESLAGLEGQVSILTVTHVEAISEQLPQRIEVDASTGTSRTTTRR